MSFRSVFDHVVTVEAAIAGGVFVLVLLGLLIAIRRRRARSGALAYPRAERNGFELAYAVLLAAIAGFLVWFTVSANAQDTATAHPTSNQTNAATVQVTAMQWCWRFHYLDQPVTVTESCSEQRYPTLVVPVGRPVRIELTSQDVVHGFWVPDLAVKVDAFPDHTNTFTLNFDHPGQWLGRCSEFCGTYHTTMHFYLRAVPANEYQQWLARHGGSA